MPQSNPRKGREGKGRIYQVIEGNPLLHDAPNYAHINYCIINYEIINAPCNLPDPAFITPPFNPSTKPKSKIPLKPAPLFTYKYHPLWDLENRYLSGLLPSIITSDYYPRLLPPSSSPPIITRTTRLSHFLFCE